MKTILQLPSPKPIEGLPSGAGLAGTPKGFQVKRAVFVKLVAIRLLTEPGSSAPVKGAA